jgi:Carbohydrate-binding module 48 (Isoamylase N-terminal domain)
MMDDSQLEPTDETLDPLVHRAASLLREPVAIRPTWRAALLSKVAAPQPRHSPVPRWVPVGLAATLCLALGFRWVVSSRDDGATTLEPAPAPASVPRGTPVRFSIAAPRAARVSLVGDFNAWNPTAVPMRRTADGDTWVVDVPLAPGRHVFAFAVDGGLRVDPAAPRAVEDDFGVPSSVVVVPNQGSH